MSDKGVDWAQRCENAAYTAEGFTEPVVETVAIPVADIKQIAAELRTQAAEISRLREALEDYGYHKADCATRGGRAAPCSCGYDAALTGDPHE